MKKLTEKQHNQGLNNCDKCGDIWKSEELVWIGAEGFAPRKGEVVPASAYKKYQALCEFCYNEVIKK